MTILIAAGIMLSASPVWGDVSAHLDDRIGDTVDSDTAAPLQVPQADIVRSSILYAADGITLNVQVRNPTAPLADKAWDGDTDVEWSVDTTGDGRPDFDIDYYTESGTITGDVSRSTDNDDEPDLCKVKSATFTPDAGYTTVVDPACIGSPATIAYTAQFTYDTNPGDDNAPDAEDTAPDTGMSPPVSLGQRAPAATPSAGQPAAPAPEQPGNTPPPAPAQAPRDASAATPASPGTAAAPAPGTAASASPAPARRAGASGNAATPNPAAPESSGRNLAGTGRASEALVALAGAVLGLGGLCVIGGACYGGPRRSRRRPGGRPRAVEPE